MVVTDYFKNKGDHCKMNNLSRQVTVMLACKTLGNWIHLTLTPKHDKPKQSYWMTLSSHVQWSKPSEAQIHTILLNCLIYVSLSQM